MEEDTAFLMFIVILTSHSENLRRNTPFDFLPLFSTQLYKSLNNINPKTTVSTVQGAQELIIHSASDIFMYLIIIIIIIQLKVIIIYMFVADLTLTGESLSHLAFAATVLHMYGRNLKKIISVDDEVDAAGLNGHLPKVIFSNSLCLRN
jgi:hypothetical protein